MSGFKASEDNVRRQSGSNSEIPVLMMETDNRYAKKGEKREIIKEGNESRGGVESGCPT